MRQTPHNLAGTILSLHAGNKEDIPFTQGKWNQGGSGALLHCGSDSGKGRQLSLVITKRNPKILEKFPETKTSFSDQWSFSILRRQRPDEKFKDTPWKKSKIVFLAPNKLDNDDTRQPLHFSSDTLPIFPKYEDSQDKPFSKEVGHGTCIVLYEYKIKKGHGIRGGGLYRKLETQLPRLPLPIRLWETRKQFPHERSQSVGVKGFVIFMIKIFIKMNQIEL